MYRIRTYEHESVWSKVLVTYDLETSIPPSTRQAGIIEVIFRTKIIYHRYLELTKVFKAIGLSNRN